MFLHALRCGVFLSCSRVRGACRVELECFGRSWMEWGAIIFSNRQQMALAPDRTVLLRIPVCVQQEELLVHAPSSHFKPQAALAKYRLFGVRQKMITRSPAFRAPKLLFPTSAVLVTLNHISPCPVDGTSPNHDMHTQSGWARRETIDMESPM
ncbi:hypothetical protein LZ30DRAFT_686983 [Colletotrichum cereale]|nr:hypothetical protein LZ30DRAFT_686983 [Colletotrichum cereale]